MTIPQFPRCGPVPGLALIVAFSAALVLLGARPAIAQHAAVEEVPVAVQPRWIDLHSADWRRGHNGWQTNFTYYLGTDATARNAGFFGQRLRRELTALNGLTPEVEAPLNRYRRQKTLFLSERFLFVGTLVVAGADLINKEHSLFPNSEKIMGGVALASLLSNIWISRNTNSHMQRTVMEYQGALFPQTPRSWVPRLRPAFGGVVPRRGGGVGLVVGWEL